DPSFHRGGRTAAELGDLRNAALLCAPQYEHDSIAWTETVEQAVAAQHQVALGHLVFARSRKLRRLRLGHEDPSNFAAPEVISDLVERDRGDPRILALTVPQRTPAGQHTNEDILHD